MHFLKNVPKFFVGGGGPRGPKMFMEILVMKHKGFVQIMFLHHKGQSPGPTLGPWKLLNSKWLNMDSPCL